MNVMLCGAGDTSNILPFFESVSKDIGFQPLNFTDGSIKYHNYGANRWEENSKLTVIHADLLIFVINSSFGNITWNIEFEEALSSGKNFIILCNSETFSLYRQLLSNRVPFPESDENKGLKEICELMQKLELDYQITIIPFNLIDFQSVLKKQILNLFEFGLGLVEKDNKKNSFLPILLSSKFNDADKIANYINDENESICKELVFDSFENKEIRKKALEFFFFSKSLNETDIISLCLDSEQGIARKAIASIGKLISENSDLNKIYSQVIESISNEEVGIIRRGIISLLEVDLLLSLKYFHLFLPSNDVGTPKRIVLGLADRKDDIKEIIMKEPHLIETLNNLIKNCLKHNKVGNDWKNVGKKLLNEFPSE